MATETEIIDFYMHRGNNDFLIRCDGMVKYRRDSRLIFDLDTFLIILFEEIELGLI
tara:strand:+ start:6107 stop:6274 length:168 start_codon:yes stop_codon:yes gene_type:complete